MSQKKMTRGRSDLQRKQRGDLLRSAAMNRDVLGKAPFHRIAAVLAKCHSFAERHFRPYSGCACEMPLFARIAAVLAKCHSCKYSTRPMIGVLYYALGGMIATSL
jgi:hypothetical protein